MRGIEAQIEIGIDRVTYRTMLAANWLQVKDFCSSSGGTTSTLPDLVTAVYTHYRSALQIWDSAGDILPIQFYGGGFGMKGAIEGMAIGVGLQVAVNAINNSRRNTLMEKMQREWRLASERIQDCEDVIVGRPIRQRQPDSTTSTGGKGRPSSRPLVEEALKVDSKSERRAFSIVVVAGIAVWLVLLGGGLIAYLNSSQSNSVGRKTANVGVLPAPLVAPVPNKTDAAPYSWDANRDRNSPSQPEAPLLPMGPGSFDSQQRPSGFLSPNGNQSPEKPRSLNDHPISNDDFNRIFTDAPPGAVESFSLYPTVELPPVSSPSAVPIGEVTFKQLTIDLVNPEFNSKKFKIIKDGDRWNVNEGENTVAQIYRDEGRLLFRWGANASEEASCLRNAVISLVAGPYDMQIALRKSKRLAPMAIDFTKKEMNEALDAEFLCGLKPIALQLQMLGLISATRIEKVLPAEQQAPIGKQVLAYLKTGQPEVSIAIGVTSRPDGVAARVVVTPQYCVDRKTMLPFTADRVKSVARADAELAKQLHSIAQPINESKGAVRYRVFFMAGPHEVELIDATTEKMSDEKE